MQLMRLRRMRGALAACLMLLLTPLSVKGEEAAGIPKKEVAPEDAAVTRKSKGIRGIATYYASRYNGRKTMSGERHSPKKMTAAHPDLPFGTKVRVVNLDNGNEVVVTVNDRCRRRKLPLIDLSREAARRLGFLGAGMTNVVMQPLTGLQTALNEQ